MNFFKVTMLCCLFVAAIFGLASAAGIQIRLSAPTPLFEKETELKMHQIVDYLEAFKKTCGRYPTSEEGLKALMIKPADIYCRKYQAVTVINDLSYFKDRWAEPLRFTSDGKLYLLDASHGIRKTNP